MSVGQEGDTHSGLAARAGVMSFGSWCSDVKAMRGCAGKVNGKLNWGELKWIEGVHPSMLKYMIRPSKVQRGRDEGCRDVVTTSPNMA